MPKDGSITKNKILQEARKLVYQNGFAGTSIDDILGKAEISKGAFFYHFKTKDDLGFALIQDYAREEEVALNMLLEQSAAQTDDPLDRLLKFMDIYLSLFGSEDPGCLFASYSYEPNQFEKEIKGYILQAVDMWDHATKQMLEDVLKVHQPVIAVDIQTLSEYLFTVTEGAMVMARLRGKPQMMREQLTHLRNYLVLLFGKNQ